MEKSYDVILVT